MLYIQEKQKEEYEKEIEKLKKEIDESKFNFMEKERELKEQLDQKDNEIIKLQTNLKLLNSNTIYNENNANNNLNISILLKSKANSSIYTLGKDDLDNNKFKYDEFYSVFKESQLNDNLRNKNRTMSNFNQSRNNHLLKILNRRKIKKTNISQANTIININSYHSKNNSTNNLKKNNSSRKKKTIDSSKNQKYKLNFHNNSSFNITNNTYNMNKNNIMINLNPKNINMNMEKMKVQKKLLQYQSLIDQKLNELMMKKHPHIKNRQSSFNLRQNSSPNIYIRNLKYPKKQFNLGTTDYYFKKSKKKKLTRNSSEIHISQGSKMIDSKSALESFKGRKINRELKSKNQYVRNEKVNSEIRNSFKYSLNQENLDKLNNLNSVKQKDLNNDNAVSKENSKENTNLSLRNFIFTKCVKPISNMINGNNNNNH